MALPLFRVNEAVRRETSKDVNAAAAAGEGDEASENENGPPGSASACDVDVVLGGIVVPVGVLDDDSTGVDGVDFTGGDEVAPTDVSVNEAGVDNDDLGLPEIWTVTVDDGVPFDKDPESDTDMP